MERDGSRKVTVLTDDVWPRSVARRVGVGVVRACRRDVWSPDAVSYGYL